MVARKTSPLAAALLLVLTACAPSDRAEPGAAPESTLGACQDRRPGDVHGVPAIFNRTEIRRLRLLSGTLPKDAQAGTSTPVTFHVVPAESPDAEPTPEVVQLPAGNVAGIAWAWSHGAAVYAGIEARASTASRMCWLTPRTARPSSSGAAPSMNLLSRYADSLERITKSQSLRWR